MTGTPDFTFVWHSPTLFTVSSCRPSNPGSGLELRVTLRTVCNAYVLIFLINVVCPKGACLTLSLAPLREDLVPAAASKAVGRFPPAAVRKAEVAVGKSGQNPFPFTLGFGCLQLIGSEHSLGLSFVLKTGPRPVDWLSLWVWLI